MPWRLTPQCCSLASHTHSHAVIVHVTLPTNKYAVCMFKRDCSHAQSMFNVVMLLSFARCGPSTSAPSSPMMLTGINTHNDVVMIYATLPPNKHVLCMRKHYAPSKFNVDMLLSFVRCGPSVLAPSTPMLFPAITHTHNHG